MTCYDTAVLDRYKSEVDAAEAREAAIEAAQDHALSILERETKAITPVQWFSKKLSSGWTMHEVFIDALDADSDITSAFAELVTLDHPQAEKLRQLLRERHAHTQYLLIVPSYDPFEYTPPPTYPDPRSPEEVRELLGPTEYEHQSEAI